MRNVATKFFIATLSVGLAASAGCKNTGGDGGESGSSTPVLRSGGSDLHAAVAAGDPAGVKTVLAGGTASLESRDKYGQTPLGLAMKDGKLEVAKILLDAGADPAAGDEKGITPLIWASSRTQNQILADMIAKKPNLDAQDKRSYTAIYHAAERSNIEGYKLLLAAGANVELRDKKGRSAADVLQIKTGRRTP